MNDLLLKTRLYNLLAVSFLFYEVDSVNMATNINLESISGEIQSSLLSDEERVSRGNAFINWIKKKRMQLRPWAEFINTKTLSKPKDVNHAGKRIVKNLDTYQANYIIICLFLSLYCMYV